MSRILQIAFMVLLAGGTAGVQAQTAAAEAPASRIYQEGNVWVEEVSGTLTPGKGFKLMADVGGIEIEGGAQPNITYVVRKRAYKASEQQARRILAAFQVRTSRTAEYAVLVGEWSDEYQHRKLNVEFLVRVPRELQWVKAATDGGGVAVRNINGKVHAETAGGGIELDAIQGSVSAETAGGGIEVGWLGSDAVLETAGGGVSVKSVKGKLVVETGGGGIEIGTVGGPVAVSTQGGGIQVSECGGNLAADTQGGGIEVGSVNGAVALSTQGGSIHLSGARGLVRAETQGGGMKLLNLTHGVNAETQAGSIVAEFVGGRETFTASSLETTQGDVIVYLPANLGVNLEADIDVAQGHTVRSDFPEVQITTEGGTYGPKQVYAVGRINGGGPLLKLHTTSGSIVIQRGRRQEGKR
ncbi:MAG: hypothetical protein L0099_01645 [Acidobacteria bacterium]|nr:hypothetical protein [Acidobacteriota bacterium]